MTMTETRVSRALIIEVDTDATDAMLREALDASGAKYVDIYTEKGYRASVAEEVGDKLDAEYEAAREDIEYEARQEAGSDAFDALADAAHALGWELRDTGAAVVTLSGDGRMVMASVKDGVLRAAADLAEFAWHSRRSEERRRRAAEARCETCGVVTDALGHCLGSCQGEEWDR